MFFFFVCVCVKNWTKFCSEYLKEHGLLEELDIAESIILKWVFKKQGVKVWWIGFMLLRIVVSMGVT